MCDAQMLGILRISVWLMMQRNADSQRIKQHGE
jgi:hypothetical protein